MGESCGCQNEAKLEKVHPEDNRSDLGTNFLDQQARIKHLLRLMGVDVARKHRVGFKKVKVWVCACKFVVLRFFPFYFLFGVSRRVARGVRRDNLSFPTRLGRRGDIKGQDVGRTS